MAVERKRKAKLGQNFLTDPKAAERIVDALGDISAKTVIEIGPGRGAITKTLTQRAGRLIAIEFDRMLAAQLRFEYQRVANAEIIEANVLNVDFDTIVQDELHGIKDRRTDGGAIRTASVVGNLPYYITSDILLTLFDYHQNFDQIVIMVQKEVADRIAAQPGTRDYGLLTVTAQMFADIEKLFTLPPGVFSPPPKVYSTVLRLKVAPKSGQLGVTPDEFIPFLKLIFGQKRKTLANNLKGKYEDTKVKVALSSVALRQDIRAEAVTIQELAQLFRELK